MAQSSGLDAARWSHRLVVVFAPAGDGQLVDRQRAELRTASEGTDDRDLVLVGIEGDRIVEAGGLSDLDAAALRGAFEAPAGAPTVLLIGKDGGVKLRRQDAIGYAELARTIDAMPMRRRERAGEEG